MFNAEPKMSDDAREEIRYWAIWVFVPFVGPIAAAAVTEWVRHKLSAKKDEKSE